MKIKLFDISWDTDGLQIDLPSEVVMEVDEDIDLENEAADLLSDKFGWCVFGCDYEILPEN